MDLSQLSDEQLRQAAGISSPDLSQVPEEELMKIAGVSPKNIIDQVGSSKLGNAVGDVINGTGNIINNIPNQNPASSGLQIVGQGAKMVSAPIAQAISAATPDALREGAQSTANALDSTDAGQFVGDKLLQAKDFYNKFSQAHPELAGDINAAANIGTTLQGGKISQPVGNAIDEVSANAANGAKGLADNYAAKYPEGKGPLDPITPKVIEPLTRDIARNAGSNAFKDADNLGGTLSPLFTGKALDILETSKQKPIAGKVLTSENKVINDALGEYEGLRGSFLTLDDYHQMDSSLGDKAAQAFVSGDFNRGRIIAQAQDKIRAALDNLTEPEVTGGKQGFDVLTKDAIPLWSAQAKLADIQKIVDRANAMDNPAPAIRTGLRNLMLSDRFKKYPPDVKSLIQKGAESGNADDLLGILGSRLNVIASGAMGGLPGTVLSLGATKVLRGVRNQMKRAQAQKINDSILEPVRPSIEKYNFSQPVNGKTLTMKEIMQMPPAQARAALAQMKARPTP